MNVKEANHDIRQRSRESQDAPAVMMMANMPDDRSRDVSKKLFSVNLK